MFLINLPTLSSTCWRSSLGNLMWMSLWDVLCVELNWCRAVTISMVSVCSSNWPTSFLKQATSRLQEAAMQRTIEILVDFVESYFASSLLCSLATSIEFSCMWDPQTWHFRNVPKQSQHVSQPKQNLRPIAYLCHRPRIHFFKKF